MGVLKYVLNIHFLIIMVLTAIAIWVFGINPWVALVAAITIYAVIQIILYAFGKRKKDELPHKNYWDLTVIPGLKNSTLMQKIMADVHVLGNKKYGYETMRLTGRAVGFAIIKTVEGGKFDGNMEEEIKKKKEDQKIIKISKIYEALLIDKGFLKKAILVYPGERRLSPLTSKTILLDGVSTKQFPIAEKMRTEIFKLQWIGKSQATETAELQLVSESLLENIALSAVNNLANAADNATKFNVPAGIKQREKTRPM